MELGPINPDILATDGSPIMEAFRWLDAATLPQGKPLINVSQAAPALPPPEPLRRFMADTILNDTGAHLYGPNFGFDPLRDALAANITLRYGGAVTGDQICITAGCNQAYTAAIATLAQAGDEVIIPTPWYFNHQMWLVMNGIKPVPLSVGDDMLPDPNQAATLINDRTRAIVLVSPNNPAGVEYPADLIRAFYDLARTNGLSLILDETYRDFHISSDAPHDLFTDPDWDKTLIHLYSFSKTYRLTGHRVGAFATSPKRLEQVEKYMDSTTICTNQLAQRAALWGLQNLDQWVAGERAETLTRRKAIAQAFTDLDGWTLKGCGAYFAFVQYPHDMAAHDFAQRLLTQESILALPGSMFTPDHDPAARHCLRIAFANIDVDGISQLHERLRHLSLAPLPGSA